MLFFTNIDILWFLHVSIHIRLAHPLHQGWLCHLQKNQNLKTTTTTTKILISEISHLCLYLSLSLLTSITKAFTYRTDTGKKAEISTQSPKSAFSPSSWVHRYTKFPMSLPIHMCVANLFLARWVWVKWWASLPGMTRRPQGRTPHPFPHQEDPVVIWGELVEHGGDPISWVLNEYMAVLIYLATVNKT